MTQRQDNTQGLTEDYYYDTLNRLDHTTLNGALNLQMGYDTTGMGNIASRSDVGGGAAWIYDPVRKHAVTQAGPYTYGYDANRNASSRDGYPITWTSYNLPTGISTANESVVFAYDANRQRWQEIYTGGPNGTEATYRAGKLFEVDTYGGLAHYRHFVYAGNELVSIDDRTTASQPQYFVVSDQQGSYLSIENSANPGTNFVAESFTPFGNRRSGADWSSPLSSLDAGNIDSVSRRGYTGESGLGLYMGLNYLNGRVEDAITGRFLSPDPLISDRTNTQAYNGYTYVNNNSATLTDPSGFSPTRVCNNWCPGDIWHSSSGIATIGDNEVLGLGLDFFLSIGGGDNTNVAAYADALTAQVAAAADAAIATEAGDSLLSDGSPSDGYSAQSGCSGCLSPITVASQAYQSSYLSYSALYNSNFFTGMASSSPGWASRLWSTVTNHPFVAIAAMATVIIGGGPEDPVTDALAAGEISAAEGAGHCLRR